jgi:hypothetical protein
MSTEKTGAEAQARSLRTLLTSAEIEAVIPDLNFGEPGDLSGDKSLDAFWLAVAIDPQGKTQAYGLGLTPAVARVKAWIEVWDPQFDFDFPAVPRVVPEGWRFEVYPPGEGLILEDDNVG